MSDKRNILDLSKKDLENWLLEHGLKKYALNQILQWLYQKRAASFEEMSNIAKEARAALAEHFEIRRLEVDARHHSPTDLSTKYLFRLNDGNSVETVLMPQKNRTTLCISSQVGCAMGCRFCRTSEMKLVRNLTQGEILGQILGVQGELPPGEKITNIVMMGMGEPFHNYDTVIDALQLMTDDFALGLSQRKITVSTVGLAPEIVRFGKDSGAKLALSLNATTEEGRAALMPVTKRYSLEEVIEACRTYAFGSKHKVTFEYVMMAGVNDTIEDAKRIAKIGARVPCKINLIPYNEYPGSPFKRPSEENIRAFFKHLADKHFQVNIRYSKGLDVLAACGQLATDRLTFNEKPLQISAQHT
ncbi:MAG TPA: 23S rRNA (adenine(2503)-C(2))-methyltransferase RlmN [bacterium]|nr:23S rRNA (adenine(2503)-C(2))-methyltransferase RlmN [bacterium]